MCGLHDVLLKPLRDAQGISAPTSYPDPRQGGFLQSLSTHVQPATIITSPVQAAPQQPSVLPHKKLWELDRAYHCSVIGTCLTLAELRQIQRRLGGIAQALYEYRMGLEINAEKLYQLLACGAPISAVLTACQSSRSTDHACTPAPSSCTTMTLPGLPHSNG
ncbi:MAG: hypothetical protein H6974_15245 [Gammaproteobacteria bacterium]|nr:hypothetical protein [Gammaproteobacteria bacterium]